MTYCVGLMVDEGLVLLSDTRTNAGLDNISTYRKMFVFEQPGERAIVIQVAGSLSVSQTVIAKLTEAIEDPDANEQSSFMMAETILQSVEIIGSMLNQVSNDIKTKMGSMSQSASASMIVSGQRKGGLMRMFLIYPEGNFIEATGDTPFLQIGEHKYGKPILDRVITSNISLNDACKAVLLSMASTMRSNLSVGMPLDLTIIRKDECKVGKAIRIEEGDHDFTSLAAAWSQILREGFDRLSLSVSD